jgi:antitoxin (DNA-binding transcriptional repressor) of toxin-antitoxin stability system
MAIIAMSKESLRAQREGRGTKEPAEQVPYIRQSGEEVVIRDRNLPVAKLVPFSAEGADDQELVLVAAGKLRLPKARLNVKELLQVPTGGVAGNKAIQAVLTDRAER